VETEKKTMPDGAVATEAKGEAAAKQPFEREPLAFVCPRCGSSDLCHCSRSTSMEFTDIDAVFEDGDFTPGFYEVQEDHDLYFFCGECQQQFYFGVYGDDSKLLAQWMLKGCPAQDEPVPITEEEPPG